jgi:hypothetical protein
MITNNTYKAVELFAGIGGFRLACNNLNIETIWANDIDPTAIKVYKSNFGKDSIVEGDIWNLIESVPSHDLLTGGFPCQDFSVAGKRKGFDSTKNHEGKLRSNAEPTEETRGKLYFWMKQVIDIVKPKIFIAENVKGLVNLGEVKEIIQKDFSSADLIVSHNTAFDFSFMRAEFERLGRVFEIKNEFCTMKKFTPVCKLPKKKGDGYKYPKLSELCAHFNITDDQILSATKKVFGSEAGYHDARFDTSAVLLALNYGIKNCPECEELKKYL